MYAERCLLYGFTEHEERLTFTALTFRDNDGALRRHFLFIKDAVSHAVCFKAQGQINFIGGHGLEVGRPIEESKRVPGAAFARDGFIQ